MSGNLLFCAVCVCTGNSFHYGAGGAWKAQDGDSDVDGLLFGSYCNVVGRSTERGKALMPASVAGDIFSSSRKLWRGKSGGIFEAAILERQYGQRRTE